MASTRAAPASSLRPLLLAPTGRGDAVSRRRHGTSAAFICNVRKALGSAVPYLLSLLFLIALARYLWPRIADFAGSLHVAHGLDLRFLILAAAAQFLSFVADADVLRATVRLSGNRVSIVRATVIETAASTLCIVAGGVIGYTASVFQWTRKSGVPSRGAAVSAFLLTLFSATALMIAGIAGGLVLLATHQQGSQMLSRPIIISSVAVIGVIVPAVFLLRRRGVAAALERTMQRPLLQRFACLRRIDAVLAQWRESVGQLVNGAWRRPAAGAMLNVAFDFATLAFIFAAAGVRIDLTTMLAGYGIPLLLGQAAPLPGGVAITELSMSAVYVSLGVQPAGTIVSVLTYRLVSFWLPTLLGIPLIVRLQALGRSNRDAAEAVSAAEPYPYPPRTSSAQARMVSPTASSCLAKK